MLNETTRFYSSAKNFYVPYKILIFRKDNADYLHKANDLGNLLAFFLLYNFTALDINLSTNYLNVIRGRLVNVAFAQTGISVTVDNEHV